MTPSHVVVAGNIAVGKTTAVDALCRLRSNCEALVEVRDEYLDRFYENPAGFAFRNQLGYTIQFLEKATEVMSSPATFVIQDRSIYDTHDVFSRMCLNRGLITPDDFALLGRMVKVADAIAKPTLMILLRAPVEVLYRRLVMRRNPAEQLVTVEYLAELQDAYDEWYEDFGLCRKEVVSTHDLKPDEVVGAIGALLSDVQGFASG